MPAYNKKKTEALVPSANRLRVGDPIHKTSDESRIIKLDALVKSENEGLLKVSNAVKEEQRQAVKEALEHNEYPSDEVLRQFEGDPDVDWEMQFRRIICQDSQLMQTFSDALHDKLAEETENGEVSHDAILKALEEATADEGIDLTEEVGNVDRFIDRMEWQSRYIGPTQADTIFRHNLSNDEFLTDVCKVLAKGIDYAGFADLSPHIFALARKENPSSYSVRMARQEIRNDLREYRRTYLKKTGQKQQLSYEDTVEGTYLDNGHEVEFFGNEEIKSLLEKDLNPVIKSLVRKNLASASTVQSLLDAMEEQREILSDELGEKDLSIERITKLLEESETKSKTTEGRYNDLQGRNRYNYEQMRRYRSLLNTMTMRKDLLETEKTINKITSQIDRAVKPSSKADSRLMQQMDTLLRILKMENSENPSVSFDSIPQQRKPFFAQDGDRIVAKTSFDKMSISQLAMLRNAMRAVRSDAKLVKAERDQARRDRVFPVIQQYMMQTQGISPESLEQYRQKMDELKFEQGPRGTIDGVKKDQPHRFKALLENQFITPSRLLRKIDGENGTALYTYFFGGIGVDGKLHTGLEGVIDEEKRREFDRYDAGRKKMQELGITEKMLYSHLTESLGKKFSVDEAIGVYVYSKQIQAVKHLLSPDGNRLTEAEIQKITSKLTDNQKAWGDWLVHDMGSRYEAISDVYYRVHNKTLGRIAQYFPLVRLGKNESFSDLMEDQFLTMQENADDSMTKERTGGDYQLRLDATVIWNCMVQKQEHYIAGAEYFSDANYMLNKNGGDLSNLIAINSGTKYAQGVQDFINRVANSRHIQDDADSMVNAVRNNMIVARLGFNMLTALKQIPTLGLFLTKYGPIRFLEAISHMTVHYKDTTAFIYDKAPQLKNRNISTDYSSLMDMEGKNAYQRTVKKIGEIGMAPIKWADDMVVNVLWYGAYQDTLSKTGDSELAAMEATKWINDTQPGGTTKDSSAIYASNSTLWKFLLMFSNQLNKNFNIAYDIPYALKQGMYAQALRSTLGLGLSFAGIMLMEGGMQGDEDDDEYIKRILREFGSQTASMMPVFGKELSDAISGRYYSDSGLPMISEGFSFVKALGTDDMERKIDRAVKLGLSGLELTGAPTGQVNKIWNAFSKDDEINLGYLLGSDFAKR